MSGGPSIRALAACALFLLVLAGLTWRMVDHLHVLGNEQDADRWGMIDFRDVVYFPTRAVIDGVNPYDSEPTVDASRYRGRFPVGNVFPVYSPLLIALDAPLQPFPYHVAMALYGVFNVALLVLVASTALRASNVSSGIAPTLLLATLMLLSRPGQSNFYYGQLALLMVLCAIVATQWSQSRPGLAVLALVFLSIKPTFGAPLLILLLAQRRFKEVLWGGAIGGGIAVVGFLLIFLLCHSGHPPLETIKENLSHTESDPGFNARLTGIRLDAVAIAERLSPPNQAATMKVVVPLAILAISALVLWMLSQKRLDETRAWIATPLIMVTTLLCVFHAAYDGLLLTLPIVSLAIGKQMPRGSRVFQAVRWILVGLLLVPAVNLFSSRQFLRALDPYIGSFVYTGDDGWLWTIASILNGLCLLAAWLILVIAALSRVHERHRNALAS